MLGWWLLLIAMLDLEHQWLPDRLTLPLIPLGLAAAWAGFGPPLAERAAGAAIGWAGSGPDRLALPPRCAAARGWAAAIPSCSARSAPGSAAWHLPVILLGAGLLGLAAVLLMRLRGEAVSGDQPAAARHADGARRLAGLAGRRPRH